ncbi:hypothetical protein BP00DRAFT_444043 [Aspergillus indologenus CBS 114.80]|uniref:Uncharacterized protein n=1 Tax=Aspergillus indologenus CBS 114.80 TaxID=1450541 RepID=A0A2V5IFB6_9EURO|nr:hypothetical protein BP00DRAFT_444043 [Aspergillus indologenus CBS 114.80]
MLSKKKTFPSEKGKSNRRPWVSSKPRPILCPGTRTAPPPVVAQRSRTVTDAIGLAMRPIRDQVAGAQRLAATPAEVNAMVNLLRRDPRFEQTCIAFDQHRVQRDGSSPLARAHDRVVAGGSEELLAPGGPRIRRGRRDADYFPATNRQTPLMGTSQLRRASSRFLLRRSLREPPRQQRGAGEESNKRGGLFLLRDEFLKILAAESSSIPALHSSAAICSRLSSGRP